MNKAKQIISLVMSIVIGGILVGYLFPVGMDALHSADTSSWTSAEQDIYEVLGIFLILAVLVAFAGWAITAFRD